MAFEKYTTKQQQNKYNKKKGGVCMPYGYIYKIENIVNGKVYIGQSVNVHKRLEGHKYDLNNNKHKNKHLQNAWNKYGKDNFIFEIIDEAEEKYTLDMIECFWIEAYGGYKSGSNYNYRSGGANGLQSQSSKDKISKATSGDNHWLHGKHLSQEHKNNVSIGVKLFNQNNDCEWKHRPNSKEQNEKISKALKGRKLSENQKQFLRDNPPAARSVTCVETEQEFFTIKAASEYFDIDAYKIRDCAKGRKSTANGYHFVYTEEYDVSHRDEILAKEDIRVNRSKAVRCVETNTIYASIKDAECITHISNIGRACRQSYRTAGGYHWEFVENV